MKAQVRQIETMSETLISTGFSKEKSNAVITSIALAMETFAVTPEVLDERIEKVMTVVRAQGEDIRELKSDVADIKERLLGLEERMLGLENRMLGLEQNMIRLERSMLRYMTVFTLLMLATLLGGFGTLVGLFLGIDA